MAWLNIASNATKRILGGGRDQIDFWPRRDLETRNLKDGDIFLPRNIDMNHLSLDSNLL